MREVEFRIVGLTNERVRFERRLRRPPKPGWAIVALVAVVVVIAVRSSPLDSGSNRAGPTHTAVVHGTDVRGERVLVLVDDSGSMEHEDAEVRSQKSRLRSAGISIANEVNVFGFAISFKEPYTLLKKLDENLAADPAIDTVYVITDFSGPDYGANQPEAYERFLQILRGHNVRLYWATVNEQPIQEYYEMARQSGGDVIPKF